MLIERPRIPFREVCLYGLWPSFIKVWLYRHIRGYRIGKGVSIAFPSIISGEVVEVGEYTSIAFMTIVRGKRFELVPTCRSDPPLPRHTLYRNRRRY